MHLPRRSLLQPRRSQCRIGMTDATAQCFACRAIPDCERQLFAQWLTHFSLHLLSQLLPERLSQLYAHLLQEFSALFSPQLSPQRHSLSYSHSRCRSGRRSYSFLFTQKLTARPRHFASRNIFLRVLCTPAMAYKHPTKDPVGGAGH